MNKMKVPKSNAAGRWLGKVLVLAALGLCRASAQSTTNVAWGSINNFDCVNETGQECHGFEIDLEDIRCTDITYTYDYNHYGTPKITEDTTSYAGHTNVILRYEGVWTNGGWSAYTAIPTNSISPTQGHQFTDPTVNFGGEHFGVGFSAQPTTVTYNWLVDDGFHNLVYGGQVYVSTPAFTLYAPAAGAAQFQAAIPAPAPPPVFYEYGDATWVKEIRTSTHTNSPVELRDLLTPDPEDPTAKDWQNGEPAEVEVEWSILQPSLLGGGNDELVAAPEDVTNSDDVVTRRWEFYAYTGGYDPETHEVMTDTVGADGIHGTGTYSNTVVVGDFLGAQMSAAAAVSPLGLIDHLQDGEVGTPYPTRSVVITGNTNFSASTSGSLPDGLTFDAASGQISGTPTTSGIFIFSLSAWSTNHPMATKNYPVWIADTGEVLPPHCVVDVSAGSTNEGMVDGTGIYTTGDTTTVLATSALGYKFANWTEDGNVVSTSASYTFTNLVNQSLVANFVVNPNPQLKWEPANGGGLTIVWPTNYPGFVLQESASPGTINWSNTAYAVGVVGNNYQATIPVTNGMRFFRLKH